MALIALIALKIVSSTDPRPGRRETGQGQLYSSHNKPTSNVGPGGASLDATQNFWKRDLRITHIPTSVAWGPDQFREKAFVGCANGDILVWDFGTGTALLGMRFFILYFVTTEASQRRRKGRGEPSCDSCHCLGSSLTVFICLRVCGRQCSPLGLARTQGPGLHCRAQECLHPVPCNWTIRGCSVEYRCWSGLWNAVPL
jgi:hypothetical protein